MALLYFLHREHMMLIGPKIKAVDSVFSDKFMFYCQVSNIQKSLKDREPKIPRIHLKNQSANPMNILPSNEYRSIKRKSFDQKSSHPISPINLRISAVHNLELTHFKSLRHIEQNLSNQPGLYHFGAAHPRQLMLSQLFLQ